MLAAAAVRPSRMLMRIAFIVGSRDHSSSQFSVLSSQFSVLSSQFSVLISQFSVLSSQFSVGMRDAGHYLVDSFDPLLVSEYPSRPSDSPLLPTTTTH